MLDTEMLVALFDVPYEEVQSRSTTLLQVEHLPLGMKVLGAFKTLAAWKLVLETDPSSHYTYPLYRTKTEEGDWRFVVWLTNAWYWVE